MNPKEQSTPSVFPPRAEQKEQPQKWQCDACGKNFTGPLWKVLPQMGDHNVEKNHSPAAHLVKAEK